MDVQHNAQQDGDYDKLDLTFPVTAESLPSLTSAQLAAVDLRLELLPTAPEHARLQRQACKLWERRNWIHMETGGAITQSPAAAQHAPPELHHALALDFSGELPTLSTAQLLAVKFQEEASEDRKEAANDEIIKRRKRAKLRAAKPLALMPPPLPAEADSQTQRTASTSLREKYSALPPHQQAQVRQATALLFSLGCWPFQDDLLAGLPATMAEGVARRDAAAAAASQDSGLVAPIAARPSAASLNSSSPEGATPSPPTRVSAQSVASHPPTAAQTQAPLLPTSEANGWDDQTAVDMDVDQTRTTDDFPIKPKREDLSPTHFHREPAAAVAEARRPNPPTTRPSTAIALFPPSSPAPNMQGVAQSTPTASAGTQSRPPRSLFEPGHAAQGSPVPQQQQQQRATSPSVTGPVAALGKLSACYLTYVSHANNVNQLLQSKAMKVHSSNIVAQIQINSATAVAYFRNAAERSSFLIRLKSRDPDGRHLKAEAGEVNFTAGLQWSDVREPHRAWLTLLCRKLATANTPAVSAGPAGSVEPQQEQQSEQTLALPAPEAQETVTDNISPALRAEYERRKAAAALSSGGAPKPDQSASAVDTSKQANHRRSSAASATLPSKPNAAAAPVGGTMPALNSRPLGVTPPNAAAEQAPSSGLSLPSRPLTSAAASSETELPPSHPQSTAFQGTANKQGLSIPNISIKGRPARRAASPLAADLSIDAIPVPPAEPSFGRSPGPAAPAPVSSTQTGPASQNTFKPYASQPPSGFESRQKHPIQQYQQQQRQAPPARRPVPSRNLSPRPSPPHSAASFRRSPSPPAPYDSAVHRDRRPLLDSYIPMYDRLEPRDDRGPLPHRRGEPHRSVSPPPRSGYRQGGPPPMGSRKRSFDAMDTDQSQDNSDSQQTQQQQHSQQSSGTSLIDRMGNNNNKTYANHRPQAPLSKRLRTDPSPPPSGVSNGAAGGGDLSSRLAVAPSGPQPPHSPRSTRSKPDGLLSRLA